MSQNSQENTCARVSFLIKVQASCNYIKKEIVAQVFFCEFCEIFKNIPNNFFIKYEIFIQRLLNHVFIHSHYKKSYLWKTHFCCCASFYLKILSAHSCLRDIMKFQRMYPCWRPATQICNFY